MNAGQTLLSGQPTTMQCHLISNLTTHCSRIDTLSAAIFSRAQKLKLKNTAESRDMRNWYITIHVFRCLRAIET